MKALLTLWVYLAGALPPAVLLLGWPAGFPVVAGASAAAAILILLFETGARRRRVPRILATLYALLALVFWLGWVGSYEKVFNITALRFHVLITALCFIVKRFAFARRFDAATLVACGVWLGLMALNIKTPFVILIAGGGLALLFRTRETVMDFFRARSWQALTPAVSALGALGFVGMLRFASRDDLHERIVAQEGVDSVVNFDSADWPYNLGREVRFLSDHGDPGTLTLGLTGERGRNISLARFDLVGRSFEFDHSVRRSSNQIAVDPVARLFYVGSENTSAILAYPFHGALAPSWEVALPGGTPRYLQLSPSGGYLAVMDDLDFDTHVMDLKARTHVGRIPGGRARCFFWKTEGELWLVPSYDPLMLDVYSPSATGLSPLPRAALSEAPGEDVQVISGQSLSDRILRLEKPVENPAGPGGWCVYDSRSNEAWFPHLDSGELVAVNMNDGIEKARLPLEKGIRFAVLDDSHSLLAVSNYLSGKVHFIDLRTHALLGEAWIGPRIRMADFSADGRTLYAASASGIFAIHVPTASP